LVKKKLVTPIINFLKFSTLKFGYFKKKNIRGGILEVEVLGIYLGGRKD